jgi:hypothetical protein
MAEMANPARHEFWRPPAPAAVAGQERAETCPECQAEFIVGSRFCHSCGSQPSRAIRRWLEIPGLTEFTALGKRLGLTTPSLIAFLFGALCLVAALSVGVLFTPHGAGLAGVQLWRIEWLLAGIAGFGAGCVLKKGPRHFGLSKPSPQLNSRPFHLREVGVFRLQTTCSDAAARACGRDD